MLTLINVIEKHISKIIKDPAPSTIKIWNCSQKTDCPMNSNCLSECLIYKASVIITSNKYDYGTGKSASK